MIPTGGSAVASPHQKPRSVDSEILAHFALDRFENTIRVWKFACLELGIDFCSVNTHFKCSPTRRYELQRTNPLLQCQNPLRQTDGFRFVVSSRAIFDGDLCSHIEKSSNMRAL